jgi:aspartyl-tRNA(Asn)/glutamyl-tRNA(Gln) amidotransferase subunit A
MCPLALGSQTGGSITRPATYCGVCGLKPTWGLLRTEGVVPVSFHLDHPGPLAGSAADLRIALEALLPAAYPTRRRLLELERDRAAAEPSDARRRIGWTSDFFGERSEPAAWTSYTATLEKLREAGAELVPIELPASMAMLQRVHRTIMSVEAAAYHRPRFPSQRAAFSPHVAKLLDDGWAASAFDYADALAARIEFRREMGRRLAQVDLLVTPGTTGPAPARLDTTGDPQFNSPWSLAGLPTVSLPSDRVDGLPVGIQLIGPWYRELSLLDAAEWAESVIQFKVA